VAEGAERTDLGRRLRAAVGRGQLFDCAPTGTTPDDLDAVDDWNQRVVTAEQLVELCTRPGNCDPRIGVRLRGAYITGTVDFSHADVQVPLSFIVCHFAEGLDLTEAHISSLWILRCAVPRLDAAELDSDHSLHFDYSRLGPVVLADARIRGGLYLTGATLTSGKDPALIGARLSTTGIACFDRAEVTGELSLVFAQIGGHLSLVDAKLTNNKGTAFTGDGLLASGGAYLRRAEVTGELRLLGAQVGSQLNLYGARLTKRRGPAFTGDRLSVTGSAQFPFAKVAGELRLHGAQIGGQLNLTGATLTNESGRALLGEGI
jgi:hypothetical protein